MVGMRRGWQCCDEMARRRQPDRAAPDMRRHAQVGRLGERRNAFRFGQAADRGDRGLHDVDATAVDQSAEVAHGVVCLTRGNGDGRAGAQLGVA